MRRIVLITSWAGAALALLVANQPWWRVDGRDQLVTGVAGTGGAVQVLLLAALAGLLLSLWLEGWGRRVLAASVALLITGAGVAGALARFPANLPGTLGQPAADPTEQPWRWVFVMICGVAVAGSVGLAAQPGAPRRASSEQQRPGSIDVWKELDEGRDPTLASDPRAEGGESGPGATQWPEKLSQRSREEPR